MKLRVLQYRESYINGAPIFGELGENVSSSLRLGLVDVAYVREDGASLEFLEGGRDGVWPGKYI